MAEHKARVEGVYAGMLGTGTPTIATVVFEEFDNIRGYRLAAVLKVYYGPTPEIGTRVLDSDVLSNTFLTLSVAKAHMLKVCSDMYERLMEAAEPYRVISEEVAMIEEVDL